MASTADETAVRSGQFRVRLPVGLHAHLAGLAHAQGVSLNTLVAALLAGGSGWQAGPGDLLAGPEG